MKVDKKLVELFLFEEGLEDTYKEWLKDHKKYAHLPKYVSLGEKGTEMRLYKPYHIDEKLYWRDAGEWGVGFKEVDGKVISIMETHDYLDNVELIPISETAWKKGNKGYI